MAVERSYRLEVVAKWEGTHGYGNIVLRFPTVDSREWVPNHPWWADRTVSGAPVTLDITPEEMAEVEVGTLFELTMKRVEG